MRTRRVFLLTVVAMIAFAGNSLLCRLALRQSGIDAATFTSIRIISGVIALWLILSARTGARHIEGSWLSAIALFAYAAAFSFAYLSLSAATGALLLFSAVQATMIIWGLQKGERLHLRQWLGLALAVGGLITLLFPGLSSPSLAGSVLMLTAGVAWGVYSLRGKGGRDPLAATAGNFLRAAPMTLVLSVLFLPAARFDWRGAVYAIVSGAFASGVGYAVWYNALPGLRAASAAAVQLSVPVLAALGGIILLAEPLTWRFFIASVCILGGIALVVIEKQLRISPS